MRCFRAFSRQLVLSPFFEIRLGDENNRVRKARTQALEHDMGVLKGNVPVMEIVDAVKRMDNNGRFAFSAARRPNKPAIPPWVWRISIRFRQGCA